MPMSMLPVVNSENSTQGDSGAVAPLTINTQPAALNAHFTQGIDDWVFNPYVENAKYFARASVGGTPAQFGDNNSTTVLLTDEHGWGIMCPNQEVFLTSCDFCTQQSGTAASDTYKVFQYPRYFILYFRQRYVKSPVVLQDIFEDYALKQVAGYTGETQNVMEVELVTGRQENAPTGMLNSTGIRNAPMNTTTGKAGAGALFSLPQSHPPIEPKATQFVKTWKQGDPSEPPDFDKFMKPKVPRK